MCREMRFELRVQSGLLSGIYFWSVSWHSRGLGPSRLKYLIPNAAQAHKSNTRALRREGLIHPGEYLGPVDEVGIPLKRHGRARFGRRGLRRPRSNRYVHLIQCIAEALDEIPSETVL